MVRALILVLVIPRRPCGPPPRGLVRRPPRRGPPSAPHGTSDPRHASGPAEPSREERTGIALAHPRWLGALWLAACAALPIAAATCAASRSPGWPRAQVALSSSPSHSARNDGTPSGPDRLGRARRSAFGTSGGAREAPQVRSEGRPEHRCNAPARCLQHWRVLARAGAGQFSSKPEP